MENNKKTKNRVAQLRKERGLSQEKLGEILFISRRSICNIEKGVYSLSSLVTIADYFGVSLDYILDRTDERYSVHKCTDETEVALWQRIKKMSKAEKEKLLKHLELEETIKSNSSN